MKKIFLLALTVIGLSASPSSAAIEVKGMIFLNGTLWSIDSHKSDQRIGFYDGDVYLCGDSPGSCIRLENPTVIDLPFWGSFEATQSLSPFTSSSMFVKGSASPFLGLGFLTQDIYLEETNETFNWSFFMLKNIGSVFRPESSMQPE